MSRPDLLRAGSGNVPSGEEASQQLDIGRFGGDFLWTMCKVYSEEGSMVHRPSHHRFKKEKMEPYPQMERDALGNYGIGFEV